MVSMRGWYYCQVKYVRPSTAKIDFIANKNFYDFVMNKAQREDAA
jgi:hypothetical protein